MSEIKVNSVVNSTGDNDSGLDLSTNDVVVVKTANTERMRLDASGKVGIGETTPLANLHIKSADSGVTPSADSDELFIEGSGNSGITIGSGSSSSGTIRFADSGTDNRGNITFNHSNEAMSFTTSASERMRVDSSGNVLVSKTSQNTATVGVELRANGKIVGTMDGGNHTFNRNTSDGSVIQISKDNTKAGAISTANGDLNIGTGDTGLQFRDSVNAIRPHDVDGVANRDNAIDLGQSSVRFDDIHATNGTIQTSDQNEKQDIASATAKELNVAKKLSALFKTFRWKDKVAEKGDKARTHTGIIAQEVQTAFKEEGLDASKYGLFTISTWWEKDKEMYDTKEEAPKDATEKTRLGVRYPELFAFIFSSIEARLTALESK